jgi:hypothetical protein
VLELLESLTDQLNAEQLQADRIGVAFAFGTEAEFNTLADHHGQEYLLFHEGYFNAPWSILGNNTLRYDHQLSLLLCVPSALSDDPTGKQSHVADLLPLQERIIAKLDRLGVLSGGKTTFNLTMNLTDRNYDTCRITCVLSLPPRCLC